MTCSYAYNLSRQKKRAAAAQPFSERMVNTDRYEWTTSWTERILAAIFHRKPIRILRLRKAAKA